MKPLFIAILPLMLAGCFRVLDKRESIPGVLPEGGGGSLADFLVEWGYWLTRIGILGLALSLAAVYFLGSKIGRGFAITAAGLFAAGITFIYVGPWIGVIVGVSTILTILVVAYFAYRNRNAIAEKAEDVIQEATGIEVDLNGDGK